MKTKKGISLIILVITIIVIIILAGIIIVSINKNNPIANANEAVFKSDVDNFKNELSMYHANNYIKLSGQYEEDKLQADSSKVEYAGAGKIDTDGKTIKDVITGLNYKKYENQFEVINGKLAYKGTDTTKQQWSLDSGIIVDNDKTNVTIATSSILPIKQTGSIEYIIDVYSNVGIKDIGDITSNIKVIDKDNNEVSATVTVGQIKSLTNEKQIPVTIQGTGLVDGEYKVKLLAGAVENNTNLKNVYVISINSFTVDSTAPTNPIIVPSTTNWTNQNITATITYPVDSAKNEYSYDGSNWQTYTTTLTVLNNCTIYARATDVTGNVSSTSTLSITNIDKLIPQTASISATVSGYNITGTITLKDNESGIDLTQSKYLISQISTVYDVNNSVWNSASTISSATQSINYTAPSNGDYYIQVLSVDKVGNKLGNISTKINANVLTVNAPVLAIGMTPIKWDASGNVVTTTSTDTSWYNYDNKQWANAQTADGSMWVWIPRYEYKIATPHSSTAQTISVNFLNGTSTTATSGYIVHPAFTFGSTQLTGIWVAKFEASGTTSAVDVKPGVTSLRGITISDMFTASRNMETNSIYGWGTSGSGIDTHLMKNIEWGAVAYLTQSIYGKNSEVWINSNSNYITGQVGTSVSADATTSTYSYNDTIYGVNASTTGNVYGIYDMSGGACEYVAGYVNNGNSYLTTYGSSLVNAAIKYKDVYTKGSNDDVVTNYSANSSIKGDAVYETSISGTGTTSWYSDYSYMPCWSFPFFARGDSYGDGTGAGLFFFSFSDGTAGSGIGFRPALAVGVAL